MIADRAGNTRNRARSISLSNTLKSVRDSVNRFDPNDVYRFKLNTSSNVTLALKDLKADANMALLDAAGKVLKRSARQGTRPESIQQTLDPGTYFIRVFPRNNKVSTSYRLTTKAIDSNPTAVAAAAKPFNIQFDYRFDNGWFTPERKAALNAAANIWENIILDEFPDTPIGTRTPSISNPLTGEVLAEFVTDKVIDDVMIFVGARPLSSGTLALGGPSGDPPNQPRYTGSKFQPWLGSIAFNTNTNWFFDSTPDTATDIPASSFDFIFTAVHEMGHVLGFLNGPSGVNAFTNQTVGNSFSGANAIALNGGQPIPLEASGSSHTLAGYQFGTSGETLMSPRATPGTRKLPTVLDLAILNDLGYTVDYSKAAQNAPISTLQPPVDPRFARLRIAGLRSAAPATTAQCGCASCLMSSSNRAPASKPRSQRSPLSTVFQAASRG
ncbi:pre-peptidase C-terminal domain-containing protein [Oculatella sp. LEGE 06141]|uniref:pre-peptidase C-terminal domain-containing protein n=1 Tax=Oculatella sp. LEGE 06141 TaxID=1828648 RepID=UPI00187E857C|nr:pre-peptidase C-terminal domain-containing protein [Oculatella sp. LEGE 06141]MBE9178237.1 pre-peptidase C-terminal domain-containing protein [Oculatella sp. LEGE 06141]